MLEYLYNSWLGKVKFLRRERMKNSYKQFSLDRRKGIGGSDIAAIMGLSPFRTALDVFLEKTTDGEGADSQCMQRGRRLEKYILEEYAERNEEELEVNIPVIKSKEYPFLIGHIDAKVKDKNIIVEAKSVAGFASIWNDEIPIYYRTQVAHYASIADADRVDVAVLFDRWNFACYTYWRNKELEAKIKKTAIDFWNNHIIKGIPPAPEKIEDAQKMYSKVSNQEEEIEINKEIELSVKELQKITVEKKELKEKEETIKLDIMKYMKDKEFLVKDDRKLVSWKTQDRNLFDITKFKVEHPAIYKSYLNKNTMRVFKVYE